MIDSLARDRRKTRSISKSLLLVGRTTVPSRNEPCGYTSGSPMPSATSHSPRSSYRHTASSYCSAEMSSTSTEAPSSCEINRRSSLPMGTLLAIKGVVLRGGVLEEICQRRRRGADLSLLLGTFRLRPPMVLLVGALRSQPCNFEGGTVGQPQPTVDDLELPQPDTG